VDDDPIEFYDDLYDMGDDEDVPMAASSSVTRGTAPPASTSVPRAKAPMSAAPRVAQASINDNEDDNETRLYKKMQALRDEVYLIFFVVWNACND